MLYISPSTIVMVFDYHLPLTLYQYGTITLYTVVGFYTQVLFVSAALSEVSSKDQRVGMSLRHLSKKFGDHEVVKDVNCDFYEGQVTVLLGHNGAAKSTTL